MSDNDKLTFTITKGSGNRGKGKNVATTWGAFKADLKNPKVSEETMQQYIDGSQDFRNKVKASNGWFMACATEGGHRTADTLYPRQIMTIDVDEPTPELWAAVKRKIHEPLNRYDYFAHLTKSATPRKPKFRVAMPTSRPIKPDHFRNLNTILCVEIVDGTLNSIDDVCFRPAQLMYRPVVSANQKYEWVENEGELIDPVYIAELWGIASHGDAEAWTDFAMVPASERQGKRRETQARAERPREKDNIVGAFCRVFNVEDAIVEFELPYEPTEGSWGSPRYTYTLGSGSGGAVVYDEGDFLYSNHQSDPCGEMGVHAFDLVRRHKFLELDKEADPETSPGRLPSFKAMAELANSYPAVRGELLASRIDADAIFEEADVAGGYFEQAIGADADAVDREMASVEVQKAFDGAEAQLDDESRSILGFGLAPAGPPKGWMKYLDVTENGLIKPTAPNLATIIENDPRFWRKIGTNEMTGHKYLRKDIVMKNRLVPDIRVSDRISGEMFSDYHRIAIRMILESPAGKGSTGYGIKTTDRDLDAAVDLVAFKHAFHPIKDFLAKQIWDGKSRLDTLFIRYLGLPDTPYHRAVSRLTMVAAITRVFEPGHKFDYAPVLEGAQGIGKSTFIKALALGRFFAELTAAMDDPKACVEQMKGGWLFMELPELAGLARAEIADVKSFITRVEDIVRLAYGREPTKWKRQCVFIGSTNDQAYLKDPTGNRRFWPIKVGVDTIDIHEMILEMPQVYAEAHVAYQQLREAHPPPAVLPLYLTDHDSRTGALEAQARARQMTASEELAGRLQDWLDRPEPMDVVVGEP